ncbi:MAG: hypothetical protein IKX67_00635 [Bacteroidales bacterium]|nr:hypothetical protein [Bacteroidales bacterium]
MKIKNTLLLLSVAAVAAVSCNLFNNFDMDVPVKVDKNANVGADKLFDVSGERFLDMNANGDLCYSMDTGSGVSTDEIALEPGKKQVFGEMVANVGDTSIGDDTELDPGQLFFTLSNPSDKNVKFYIDIEAQPASKAIETGQAVVVVPAGRTEFTVLFKKSSSDKPFVDADEEIVMDSKLTAIFNGRKLTAPVKFNVYGEAMTTKADIAPAAAGYKFKVSAKLLFPIKMKKGASFTLQKTFSNLGLNLSEYTIKAKHYDINVDVTSTMPFEIMGTGESVQGVSAAFDKPIAAGSAKSPKKSSIVISMTDETNDGVVHDAVVVMKFTAAEDNAKLSGTLTFHYDSIKMHQI